MNVNKAVNYTIIDDSWMFINACMNQMGDGAKP